MHTPRAQAAPPAASAELDGPALVRQLRALGVGPADTVMVHASLRALGRVNGGAATVAQALLRAVSPGGTLLAYVSWADSSYDATLNGRSLSAAQRDTWPAFDPATAAPFAEWGVLNTHLLALPGACRSPNPDASMAAIGRHAHWLTRQHPLDAGYGPGSPLERLLALDGKVLLLGAPLDAVTLLHYTEAVADIPGKRTVSYEVPVLRDGRTVWLPAREFDSNGILDTYAAPGAPGAPDAPDAPDAVHTIASAYAALGRHAQGLVGSAPCHLFPARDLHAFGLRYLRRHHGGPGTARP